MGRAAVLDMPERMPALVGTSAAMQKLRALVAQVAEGSSAVLVRGETGTGKELVARTVHALGTRRAAAFIAVNCAAITETLIDSELFGHAKGAFTGADTAHRGLFEAADGGTIFLDEIGDMPLATQARLLRVLQEEEVRPVGSTQTRKINVRVIAATNVDLEKAVRQGRFREDLYYRLSVLRLEVPALRVRLDDVPALAVHFLASARYAAQPAITPAALEALSAYGWPGNVRELSNTLEYARTMAAGATIGVENLPPQITERAIRPAAPANDSDELELALTYSEARTRCLRSFEERYLRGLLATTGGNVSEASRRSGIDRSNLRRMLHRNQIATNNI
jgi:two-component system, NtrC family, response regulator HydG